MFTFSTPCLRWKLVLALKGQYGWPGFTPPYATRYLNKLVVIRTTPAYGYGTSNQGPTTVRSQSWVTDRITGNSKAVGAGDSVNADFPYGLPLDDTWQVSETYFKQVINNGYFVIQT